MKVQFYSSIYKLGFILIFLRFSINPVIAQNVEWIHQFGTQDSDLASDICTDVMDNDGDGEIDEGLICDDKPGTGTTVEKVTQTVVTTYPTRFNDRLNLQIEIGYSAIAKVQFFNLQGRLVMAKKDVKIIQGKNDLSFDVAGLAPSMYMLVLNTGREEFKMKVFAK